MIVTLEEAIAREEDIVADNERFCAVAPPEITADAYHSATYHRRIAEWLKELAERKTGRCYSDGYSDGLRDATTWNPYPLVKPQKYGEYLVTRFGKVTIDRWVVVKINGKDDSHWEYGGAITAWADKPEPYKEVDE